MPVTMVSPSPRPAVETQPQPQPRVPSPGQQAAAELRDMLPGVDAPAPRARRRCPICQGELPPKARYCSKLCELRAGIEAVRQHLLSDAKAAAAQADICQDEVLAAHLTGVRDQAKKAAAYLQALDEVGVGHA